METNTFDFNYPFKDYKESIDYFYKLDDKKKRYIIKYVFKFKDSSSNKMLSRIYDMYKVLLHKLEYDKLNGKERYIYEYINAYLVYFNHYEYSELFDKYCKKYLNNITINNIYNRLLLIIQNVVNILNKRYNMNVKLENTIGEDEKKVLASVDIISDDKIIYVNNNIFERKITKDDVKYYVANIIFVIAHEYRHILQLNDMLDETSLINKDLIDEVYLRSITYSFYIEYHNFFITEVDANKFAFSILEELFGNFFDDYDFFELRDIKDGLKRSFDSTNGKNIKLYKMQRNILLKCYDFFKIETDNTKKLKKMINVKKNS